MEVEVGGAAQVIEAGDAVAPGDGDAFVELQAEALGEIALAELAGALIHGGGRDVDSAAGALVGVVVEDDAALVTEAVGVGEDVFVDRPVLVPEVVEGEVFAFGEDAAVLEQGGDLSLVALDEVFARPLVHLGLLVLHAVALGVAFDLAVAEHGQAGEGGEERGYAEVLVAVAELVDCGALVGGWT